MPAVRVADASALPHGGSLSVELEGCTVALFRTDAGLFALEDTCSHSGAPLCEGALDGTTVLCPWHGAAFDLRSGAALSSPASLPVRCFRVHERDGGLFVEPA